MKCTLCTAEQENPASRTRVLISIDGSSLSTFTLEGPEVCNQCLRIVLESWVPAVQEKDTCKSK